MSKSAKSPAKVKKPKLPYSYNRDRLQEYLDVSIDTQISHLDLMYLGRLVDLRKSQIEEFRRKVLAWTPFTNTDSWMLGYYGTIFEEIDIEIKTLETLNSRLCHIFEQQCKEK